MLRGRCASTSYDVDDTIRSFDDFFFLFYGGKIDLLLFIYFFVLSIFLF